jgi:transcriptional regulator with XRE-family HTH domain
MRNLNDVMNSLPADRRDKINKRVSEAVAEEMSLREIRKANKLTQDTVAKNLNMTQSDVSKLERRTDMYVSTLRNFVHATGGEMEIVVRYPDSPPIKINQFSDLEENQDDLLEM